LALECLESNYRRTSDLLSTALRPDCTSTSLYHHVRITFSLLTKLNHLPWTKRYKVLLVDNNLWICLNWTFTLFQCNSELTGFLSATLTTVKLAYSTYSLFEVSGFTVLAVIAYWLFLVFITNSGYCSLSTFLLIGLLYSTSHTHRPRLRLYTKKGTREPSWLGLIPRRV
jgi:hypothetical protein